MPGSSESPVAYTTTSMPRAVSALANSPTTSSVPPYPLGGTDTKGVDTSATRRVIPPPSRIERRKNVHRVTARQSNPTPARVPADRGEGREPGPTAEVWCAGWPCRAPTSLAERELVWLFVPGTPSPPALGRADSDGASLGAGPSNPPRGAVCAVSTG